MNTRYEKTTVGNGESRRVDVWKKIDGDWENVAYATANIETNTLEFSGGRDNEEKENCVEKVLHNRKASRGRVAMSDGTV